MSTKFKTYNEGEESLFLYVENFLESEDLLLLEKWLNLQNYFSGTSKTGNVISRKQIWFQENEKYFCKKWKNRYDRWFGHKYPTILSNIQDKVQKYIKSEINDRSVLNSCLINLYETGNDKITAHRDSLDSFGEYPTIVNLSIGATRTLRVSNKKECIDFALRDNSLFIMSGASQKYYVHEILKDSCVNDIRYSMTFRELKD